jgi:hypothetical protein
LFTGEFLQNNDLSVKKKGFADGAVCIYPTISLGTIFAATTKPYSNVSLFVHTMNGSLAYSNDEITLVEGKENVLTLETPPGFYVLSLFAENKKIASQIIIVN